LSAAKAYPSPKAFRQALTDKLRFLARTSKWSLPQLQRQIAYDRLLERLYLVDEGWVVKGATALLARDLGVRASIDVDLYRNATAEIAERELRQAAALDLGDWFDFALGARSEVRDGAVGLRVPVTASIGSAPWAQFHVDLLGAGLKMTGAPEDVPALARVAMPDVAQHGYRAYPLVDHVADKVLACFDRYGAEAAPSTRYKDLVDLVAIALAATVPAEPQLLALDSEAKRRGVHLPKLFRVPDRSLWGPGYAAEAKRSLLPIAHSLDEALAMMGLFLNPLLGGTAAGCWDPDSRRWGAEKPGR
jgi:hypothetical protein